MRVIPLVCVCSAVLAGRAWGATPSPDKISGSFGGVQIKNQSREAAGRVVRRRLGPRLERRVALTVGSKIVYRRRRDLGFSLDVGRMFTRAARGDSKVPVLFAVNEKAAKTALTRLESKLNTQTRDARPVLVGKRVQIRPEVVGRRLDVGASVELLQKQAAEDATQTRFALNAKSNAPRLTSAKLKGINAVLGTYTTRFNAGQVKRTINVRLGVRAIDGTLLSPNEVFSLNQTVGERTQARGYRTAVIFVDGRKEPGLGGGVSQVTGTLFNAALVAGLPIVTYRTHSRPVAYLPIGRDATVSWGNFDMKFKNDTRGPIFVSYRTSGNRLIATLFGQYTGRTTRVSVTKRRNGERDITANLYRVIRQEGKVIKRGKVGTSRYDWKADKGD